MKRSPLARKTPLRPRRATLRRGELTREQKHTIRLNIYQRAHGWCELQFKGCMGRVPFDGSLWQRGHLAHMRSVGAGGDWSDENLRWACPRCHLEGMHTKGLKSEGL